LTLELGRPFWHALELAEHVGDIRVLRGRS
jgi:hypothetical protein